MTSKLSVSMSFEFDIIDWLGAVENDQMVKTNNCCPLEDLMPSSDLLRCHIVRQTYEHMPE